MNVSIYTPNIALGTGAIRLNGKNRAQNISDKIPRMKRIDRSSKLSLKKKTISA
jgi:hypothetical protein